MILCHGSGANRAQFKEEGRALVAAGFGVLLFDWPGQGESEGEVHWNEGERVALRAAITWALARPEVDPPRVGAYGFSMGGYTLSQVAAEDTRLRAVVLAGTPLDQRQQVHYQYGRLGLLAEWPALYALRRGGMQIELRKPIDEVKKIYPRPLMVIGGSEDYLVAPSMTLDLANAASQPESAYVVVGAQHGNYSAVGGVAYLDRVVSSFDELCSCDRGERYSALAMTIQGRLARIERRAGGCDWHGGAFPGAASLAEYWKNLCSGLESVKFFSDSELASAGESAELLADPAYVRAWPVLADIDRFDAAFFGDEPA